MMRIEERKGSLGWQACSGCGVCALPCPMWQQHRDVELTPHGWAKALQGGAEVQELEEGLQRCILCGACDVVCPENIDTIAMILRCRLQLAERKSSAPSDAKNNMTLPPTLDRPVAPSSAPTVLVPDAELAKNEGLLKAVAKALRHAGPISVASDTGEDISACLQSGLPIERRRRDAFVFDLKRRKSVIAADGLMHRFLRQWLPKVRILSIGEVLLQQAYARHRLGNGDLYVIEARAYHSDFRRLARFYIKLRQERGCNLNLDLQRVAIPARSNKSISKDPRGVDSSKQVQWLLDGRSVTRFVVEDPADMNSIAAATDIPVVHVSALTET